MRSLKMKHTRALAFILLVLELSLVLYCGYVVAENHALNTQVGKIDTSDMNLTFKEDVTIEKENETIIIPKGTVIKPETILYMGCRMIGFYYSTTGYSLEECRRADPYSREEKGIYYLSQGPESFEEYEELEKLCAEKEKQANDMRRNKFLRLYLAVVCLCFAWLAVWIILCVKKKVFLLYLMDIMLIPVFLIISLFLYTGIGG